MLLRGVLLAVCGGAAGCSNGEQGGDDGVVNGMSSSGSIESSGSGEGEGEATSSSPSEDEHSEPAAQITWHQDIAPVIARKCGGCHVSGGIAPLSLQSYAEAQPFAALLLDAVERRSMPPFLAERTEECEPRFDFKDDPRLTAPELAQLRAWVDHGAPEGDPETAAALPAAPDLELKDADIHLTIPGVVTVTGSKDHYVCFSIDPGFTEDVWLDGVQISPGNHKIVHHVIAYVDPERASEPLMGADGSYPCFGGPGLENTSLIGAWAPGALPFVPPEQVAVRVEAGARIVLSIHYHPSGGEEQDSATALHLRRHVGVPTYAGLVAMIGNAGNTSEGLLPGPNDPDGQPSFLIPAGAVGHTETMSIDVGEDLPDLRIFGTSAHMHYIGTDMMMAVHHGSPAPDGLLLKECLLHTPRWGFQWQQFYGYAAELDEMPRVVPGERIYLRCTYDNSLGNPAVVKALAEQGLSEPQDVVLGEDTLDEMCLGVFGIAVKVADLL